MTTPLTINIDSGRDGAPSLVAAGEIDLSNVDTFSRAVNAAIADHSGTTVTLDLRAIDYIDSGGINVLFNCANHIRLIVKPLLIPVLTISGLTELAPVEAAPAPGDQ
jgi:anti-anti-sigma factor